MLLHKHKPRTQQLPTGEPRERADQVRWQPPQSLQQRHQQLLAPISHGDHPTETFATVDSWEKTASRPCHPLSANRTRKAITL